MGKGILVARDAVYTCDRCAEAFRDLDGERAPVRRFQIAAPDGRELPRSLRAIDLCPRCWQPAALLAVDSLAAAIRRAATGPGRDAGDVFDDLLQQNAEYPFAAQLLQQLAEERRAREVGGENDTESHER